MVGAVAVVAALALSACGGGSAGSSESAAPLDPKADLSKQTLTVSNWADYTNPDVLTSFTSEFGTPVTMATHASNEEIMGKLTAGGDSGIDIAFVSGQYAQALDRAGLLEHLDQSLIPNLKNLYPEASTLAYDVGNVYSVPYAWGTTGLCYRSDLVKETPDSWDAILNPPDDTKGKITMLWSERWLLLPALKKLGYSNNTVDPAELEKAKELTLAAKKNLLTYDDTTFYNRLVSGESVMAVAWDGWCSYAIAENPDVKFVLPKEGSDIWTDTLVVLKSSKNKEAAHAFLNSILDAKNQSWVATTALSKVPNKASMDMVGAELAKQYPAMGMTPAEIVQQEQILDLGDKTAEYTQIATEITAI
ncbi:MAG: spermidine/putrescine ABC transporter substrate-binding protein [Actinobacteria bacterium]|nr:spermidine/putrescine ABC transporter substrate-binding protein [Actinomycetota bacterium]